MRHYLSLWKRIFDYKGVSTRQEYRVPLIVTAILAALTAVLWIVGSVENADVLMGVGVLTGILFTLHVIPMMALTVRRLRDAGKKPWLAVLSVIAGIGTLFVMAICLFSVSVSGFLPIANFNANVYGPPPGIENYDPEDNVPVAVYGPPEMLYSQADEEAGETAETAAPEEAADPAE